MKAIMGSGKQSSMPSYSIEAGEICELTRKLTYTQFKLYLYLKCCEQSGNGFIRVQPKQIMKDLGISRRTLWEAITTLEEVLGFNIAEIWPWQVKKPEAEPSPAPNRGTHSPAQANSPTESGKPAGVIQSDGSEVVVHRLLRQSNVLMCSLTIGELCQLSKKLDSNAFKFYIYIYGLAWTGKGVLRFQLEDMMEIFSMSRSALLKAMFVLEEELGLSFEPVNEWLAKLPGPPPPKPDTN